MAHVRSYAPAKPCALCGKSFRPRKDCRSAARGKFCSIGCANLSRKKPPPLNRPELGQMYTNGRMSLDEIAKAVGSNRHYVRRAILEQGIVLRSGGSLPTENSHRTIYRKEASKSIGRPLKPGETVHHIDLDETNNNPKNLAVLASRTAHQQAHWKLQELAAKLVKADLILWEGNTYIFSGKMADVLRCTDGQ